MAGQPLPPRIVEAFAINAPNCTQAAPIPGGKVFPFPVPSQQGIKNGAASLNDGFPPLTMTSPSIGGVPPYGIDMNGVLYPHSAWVVFLAAGQLPPYDAELQTAMGGYALGARLQQAGNPLAIWISAVNGNTTDPDTGGAGWISSVPLYTTVTPSAGTIVTDTLPGPSDYLKDVDTSAGNIIIQSITAQRDGQRATYSNTGANLLQFDFLAGTVGDQIRANGANITVLQNDSVTFQYCQELNSGVGAWVVL